MKKVFLFAALLCSLSVSAQVRFGAEAGLNINSISGIEGNPSFKSGARLGVTTDIAIANRLYIQPGLFFSNKGVHTQKSSSGLSSLGNLGSLATLLGGAGNLGNLANLSTEISESYSINYLQLPVHIIYRFSGADNSHFFAGITVSAAYAIDGTYTSSNTTSVAGFDLSSSERRALTNDDISRFDALGGLNIGYQHNSGFFLRGFYELGLIDNSLGQNQSFGISVGYLIGDK